MLIHKISKVLNAGTPNKKIFEVKPRNNSGSVKFFPFAILDFS